MAKFPVEKLLKLPLPVIESNLPLELTGTLICDPGDCKHRYGRWKDKEVTFEIEGCNRKFKGKSRKCSKCGSYDVEIIGKLD